MKPQSEAVIQKAIVTYLRGVLPRDCIVHHIRNQGSKGGLKGKIEGGKLKEMGLLAGMPDLIVLLPSARVVWFEVKNDTGTATRTQQHMWQRLRILGHDCAMVRSVDEVRNALKAWGVDTREVNYA